MINPGDTLGDFLITTGSPDQVTFAWEVDQIPAEAANTFTADVPWGTKLVVTTSIYDDSFSGKLDEYWENFTYELSIEGKPVNLTAFGTLESEHPVVGTMRQYNVVIVANQPGKITTHEQYELPDEQGEYTTTFTFLPPEDTLPKPEPALTDSPVPPAPAASDTPIPPTATMTASPEQPVSSIAEIAGVWKGYWSDQNMLFWEIGDTGQTELTWEKSGDTLNVEWITIQDGILTFGDIVRGDSIATKCLENPAATYEVYLTRRGDQPESLRFVLVGEDSCLDRQFFYDGQTLRWVEP
jgi:hypothetical protein